MAFSFIAIIYRSICFGVIATLQKNNNDTKTTAGSSLAVVFVSILKNIYFRKIIEVLRNRWVL